MIENQKGVDGFRFMPPSLTAWIKKDIPDAKVQGTIPWTELNQPAAQK